MLTLPPLVDIAGDEASVEARLYQIFCDDFVFRGIKYRGFLVQYDTRIVVSNRQEFFWHLTRYGQRRGKDGNFDPERARRIGWPRAVIVGSPDPTITEFDYLEKGIGPIRKYLWLKREKYRVILEKMTTTRVPVFRLITAHPIDLSGVEKDMEKKYKNRLA